jgi:hypothetical protein
MPACPRSQTRTVSACSVGTGDDDDEEEEEEEDITSPTDLPVRNHKLAITPCESPSFAEFGCPL